MSQRFGDCGQSCALPNAYVRKVGRANLFAIIRCQVRTLVVWTAGQRIRFFLGHEQFVRAPWRFLRIVAPFSTGVFLTISLTLPWRDGKSPD